MAQGRSFWDWYAHVNDDLRHHLIERGWYGQQTRDDTFQRDVAAMSATGTDQHFHYTEARAQGANATEAPEGIGRDARDSRSTESAKDAMERFYGHQETDRTTGHQEPSLTEYYCDRIQDR